MINDIYNLITVYKNALKTKCSHIKYNKKNQNRIIMFAGTVFLSASFTFGFSLGYNNYRLTQAAEEPMNIIPRIYTEQQSEPDEPILNDDFFTEDNTKDIVLANGETATVFVAPTIHSEMYNKKSSTSISTTARSITSEFQIPNVNSSHKTYMSYKAITNKNSKQYKLQQNATTDEFGFRKYEDCYMIALGTYYTGYECGKKFKITLDSGISFNAITGDVKADIHTDAKNQHRNGNIVEFIVDTDKISETCKKMGDMSYANNEMFKGQIASIDLLQ